MSLNKYMHPRNPYKSQKPDFKVLSQKYPEFCGHLIQDTAGKLFLDFKNPEALRVLTKILLKEDFGLDVELPQDRLVPTIPLRLNYLLWVEDILGQKKADVRGIDIGTGSSCVYPLLGNKTKKWTFLATDIDAQNIFYAKKNVEKNKLSSVIKVKRVTEDALITGALFDTEGSFDFCMCNPPFFADHMEAQAVSSSRSADRPEPTSVSTASPKESIAQGGEVAFIKKLMVDSVAVGERVRVYTSMVGKKTSLPSLKQELRRLQVPKYATTEFCQGKTMRWGIAWTFDNTVIFPKSVFQAAKSEKPPLTYTVPFGAGGAIYDVVSLTQHVKTLLDELKMTYKEKKCHKGFSCLSVQAFENTWTNQRRKRRQKMRLEYKTSDRSVETVMTGESGSRERNSHTARDDTEINECCDNSTNRGTSPETSDNKNGVKESHTNSADPEDKVGLVQSEMETKSLKRKLPECSDDDVKRKRGTGKGLGDTDTANSGKCVTDGNEVAMVTDAEACKREMCSADSSKLKKKMPILKFVLNLMKPAGVTEIKLEMIWREGDKRDMLHQVMQYFKNKLKAVC